MAKTDAEKVTQVVEILGWYEAWYVDSPEDSWRLERDLRAVLELPQAEVDY